MDDGSLQSEREFQNELFLADKLVNSDQVVKLLGFASSRKRRRMCLVYELMPHGNLQDCLLHKKCEELMDWSNRFRIAVEVAKALAYLHHHCNPPVIHGDVKPSNVLLDANFSAKIADFGLARLKLVDHKNDDDGNNNDEVVVHIAENGLAVDHSSNVGGGVEDIGSVMETESLSTTVGLEEGSAGVDQSPVRIVLPVETSPEMVNAAASPSDFVDRRSDLEGQFDSVQNSGKDMTKAGNGDRNGSQKAVLGKELLQKQESGGVLGSGMVKDYVMEWIGKEVGKERPNGDWIAGATSSSSVVTGRAEKKKGKKKLEWWGSMDDRKVTKRERRKPVREWWKEEYCEELSRKKKKRNKKLQGAMSADEENWWPRDDEMYIDEKKKRNRNRLSSKSSVDWWLDGWSGELWKVNQTNYDSMSGEIPKSGGISSTPSMRGTVFYVAPEYSMGGDLSEKCDVYSFGVLLLVLISGRRPLQVTGSPMSEFHRANLISWARQLARSRKLLDLVDRNIHSLNKDEAQLCIVVALICLQKSPARRPSMKEVVGMLTGELDPPQLPMEYRSFKSRKKLR